MFGTQPNAASAQKFSFGASGASSVPASTSAPASSAASAFSFGLGTSTQASGFGASTNPLGGTTGLSFGSKPTASVAGTTATPATGAFSLGSAAPAASATTGTLGGIITSQAPSFGFGSPSTSSGFKGLGGTALPGQSATGASAQATSPKETSLPPEIQATVDEFKKYVEDQKKKRDEIVRFSSAPIHQVNEDVATVHGRVASLARGMAASASDVKRLKEQVMTDLRCLEVAQNTQAIPFGLQYENTAPVEFFFHLIGTFDRRINEYAEQMRVLDKYVTSLSAAGSSSVKVTDIRNLLNRLYATVVRLAGEANVLHQRIENSKAEFASNAMNQFHNPFAVDRSIYDSPGIFPQVPIGPAPTEHRTTGSMLFSMSDLRSRHQPPPVHGLNVGSVTMMTPQRNPFQQQSSAFGTSFSAGSGFGLNTTQPAGGSIFGAPVENKSGFQLQMPPGSNKRGKR